MRDQELVTEDFYGASPYDEYGPYDLDTAPGPSRPTPLPYDDPYQEEVSIMPKFFAEKPVIEREFAFGRRGSRESNRERGRGRGRSRGRGTSEHQSSRDGGDREGWKRGSGSGSASSFSRRPRQQSFSHDRQDGARPDSRAQRSLSPTSLAIARATGQYMDGSTFVDAQASAPLPVATPPVTPGSDWHQHQYSQGAFGASPLATAVNPQYQSYVQPHINPRFAQALGINLNFVQGQQYPAYQSPVTPTSVAQYGLNGGWGDGWPAQILPGPGGTGSVDGTNQFAAPSETELKDK